MSDKFYYELDKQKVDSDAIKKMSDEVTDLITQFQKPGGGFDKADRHPSNGYLTVSELNSYIKQADSNTDRRDVSTSEKIKSYRGGISFMSWDGAVLGWQVTKKDLSQLILTSQTAAKEIQEKEALAETLGKHFNRVKEIEAPFIGPNALRDDEFTFPQLKQYIDDARLDPTDKKNLQSIYDKSFFLVAKDNPFYVNLRTEPISISTIRDEARQAFLKHQYNLTVAKRFLHNNR